MRDVGIEEIIERAGVAKATLYSHFSSKDELVLAFLDRRQQLWTHEWLEAQAKGRSSDPKKQLLAIFEVFDQWFHSEEFEGCSFINVLLEMGQRHPAGQASIQHLGNIRTIVGDLARAAGLKSPSSFARSWHILMKGSIIAAAEGDRSAARRAKSMADRSWTSTHQRPGDRRSCVAKAASSESKLIPANEAQRLARRYDALHPPPDGAFDRITRLAARQLGVPISIVGGVDTDRIGYEFHHRRCARQT